MGSGRERSGRSNDKRERILTAALKVFARAGFYNAKVSEIAREAGVADGTIYLYFKNKDDLLISTFEDRMGWLIDRLQGELEKTPDDPLERLRLYIRLHMMVALEDRDLAEFITVELRQSSKFVKEYSNPKFSAYLGLLRDLFAQGQARGQLKADIDPRLATRVLFGALDEVMRASVLGRKGVSAEDVEYNARQVEQLLLWGMTVPEGRDAIAQEPEAGASS